MAETRTYSDKLQDPRWQKRRLAIFELDRWSCRRCGDTTTNLQVHHIRYVPGLAPWDYPTKDLITLCARCHAAEHGKAPATPVHVSEVITKIEYEGLYKEDPPVLKVLDQQLKELQDKLKEPLSDDLQEEVLKNIMFLQDKRKELTNG